MKHQAPSESRNERQLKRRRKKVAEVEDLQSVPCDISNPIKQALSLLHATLDSTANGLLVINNSGKIVSYNKIFLKMWRIPPELAGQGEDQPMVDYVMDQLQSPEVFQEKIRYLYSHPEEESFDIIKFKDSRVFERFSRPQKIGDEIVGRVWSFHDVTERTQTQTALEQSKAEFEAIFRSIADAAVFVDTKLQVVLVNPACTRIFGYNPSELKGKSARILFVDNAEYLAAEKNRSNSQITAYIPLFECRYRRKDGSIFPGETIVSPVIDQKGQSMGFLSIIRDITERKKMENDIRHLAYHDTLTGLSNRDVFMDHLELAITQSHRNNQRPAVLFLDLDRFKHINDAFGHAAGDQVLKEVAMRLMSCIRDTDSVSRIGGDEFSILLPNIKHAEDAGKIADKIITAVQKPFIISGHELHISTSIGISIYPDDSVRPEILLNCADIAMYHAKELGRGSYQFYSPVMKVRTIERITFENSLRKALDRSEFLVHYQPQVDLVTRRIVSAEALVRWQHPELGLVSPGQFISLAEDCGIIKSIGEYVLQTACAQNKAWQQVGRLPLCVTVNLSTNEFQNPEIVKQITRILHDTGLDPQLLELEITESTAMMDAPLTVKKLQMLADMGIRFALDDFGTGYSSLSYLKKFPIRKLKIDKTFIKGLKYDPDARAIVYAVIAMAHSMNLSVVAEGVETDEQMDFLKSCHCDQIQGFLYSRPLSVADFQKLARIH